MSLSALNIASGYEDGTYRPEESMTRGLATEMLVQAFDIPLQASTVQHFGDVPTSSPYFPYVEAAYARGLISGYKDGTFRLEQAITRGALIQVVVQAAGWELVKPQKPTFSDVGSDSPLYVYVETASAHGVLVDVAMPDGPFQPDQEATRGETAAFIARTMPAPTFNSGVPMNVETRLKELLAGRK
jgi:hypothetical protein